MITVTGPHARLSKSKRTPLGHYVWVQVVPQTVCEISDALIQIWEEMDTIAMKPQKLLSTIFSSCNDISAKWEKPAA